METPLTSSALAYTWRQLAQRAGVAGGDPQGTGFEGLDIPVFYGQSEQFRTKRQGIVVTPAAPVAWRKLLDRPSSSLDWLPVDETVPSGAKMPFSDRIPVLFWGEGYEDGHKPFAERREDGSIVFYADIIAATFFMLSRWEETVVPVRDQHDRFPATASVAYKQGFLDRPIIDEYALILRAWIQTILPGWKPKKQRFRVKLTHDIDYMRQIGDFPTLLMQLAAHGLKRRRPDLLGKTLAAYRDTVKDPYYQGIAELASISETSGFRSAFYFMAAGPGFHESDYQLSSPQIRRCIRDLRLRGHEIGFHAGYRTAEDPIRFAEEKNAFQHSIGITPQGGRQHYLRFRVPQTWRLWDMQGFIYDSSMGYAGYEGFRCGTCHPFHPFDLDQQRELSLLEYPLIVMDQTLQRYRSLSPQQAKERIMLLANRCKQVGGVFTILWHNTSLSGHWLPWRNMYQAVVTQLAVLS